MALGDLIYEQAIPAQSQLKSGSGITSLPGQFLVTESGKLNAAAAYLDVMNDLNLAGTLVTPEALSSIHYHEGDDTYWGLAQHVNTGPTERMQIFHFRSDGTPIGSFDITDALQLPPGKLRGTALSLSPDGSQVMVAMRTGSTIYRFSTTGDYLGTVNFLPEKTRINGITTDGESLWVCSPSGSPARITMYQVDSNFNILDSFTAVVPNNHNDVDDIEFDKYNFAPKCAIVVKSASNNSKNRKTYIYGYEVPCNGGHPCRKPPVITASNRCLSVGDPFDPLAGVTATDCDGSDIPVTMADVIFNNVDTAIPGMYTVTYEVTSPINGRTSTKTIHVVVLSTGARYQAITDLIQSVSMEQTALGHILNAEGKKIQKAKALDLTFAEMIKINDSVEDMVKSITALEMVLQLKLGLFGDCLCGPQCKF